MSRVQSVERAISLLGEVASRPAGLVDLASAVGLPTSTAARLLATLEGVGAVRRNDAGVYLIGPAMASLAASADPDTGLARLAHGHMARLVAELDEAIGLAVPMGSDAVTITQLDVPRPVRAEDWTGSRWPLSAGCSGIVVMATWTAGEVDRHLSGGLPRLTDRTETDPGRIKARIAKARVEGVAWSHGEYVADLSSAAAAIVDRTGRGVAALYVYGPSYRFPGRLGATVVEEALRRRATEISRAWTTHAGGDGRS